MDYAPIPRDEGRDTITTTLATDIDCSVCLANVYTALVERVDVDRVIEDAAAGTLVVTHRTDPSLLRDLVVRLGHRLVEADNGELGMESATVESRADPHGGR